jgi:hypothetical protein
MKQPPQQLPLFPAQARVDSYDSLITDVRWSYSRRETFERCLRQYYYDYYGAKKTTAQNDPNKEQIEFLSRLGSRHLRAGKIVQMFRFIIRMLSANSESSCECGER